MQLPQRKLKARVALKYCGSCNPDVDLTRIARHLTKIAGERGDFELVSLSQENIDVVVILCGCLRACGDKEEVRARAKRCLVIAGESLNGTTISETHLPAAVEQELARILQT